MEFLNLGWRHLILLFVGLACIYLALLVMRLTKVGKASAASGATEAADSDADDSGAMVDLSREIPHEVLNAAAQKPAAPGIWSATSGFAAAGATAWAAATRGSGTVAAKAANASIASNAAPVADESAAQFAQELARSHVEVDVQQLRRESSMLREELTRLREELAGLKAARNVSPLYGEAMSLAQNGVSADGIAGQCGISLAEAELVAALARGEAQQQSYPSGEDQNGGYPDPNSRTGTHG